VSYYILRFCNDRTRQQLVVQLHKMLLYISIIGQHRVTVHGVILSTIGLPMLEVDVYNIVNLRLLAHCCGLMLKYIVEIHYPSHSNFIFIFPHFNSVPVNYASRIPWFYAHFCEVTSALLRLFPLFSVIVALYNRHFHQSFPEILL